MDNNTTHVRVEDNENLSRDLYSKGIINTNWTAYEAAVKKSNLAKIQKAEHINMKEDIESLKNDIQDIKSLLLKVVENNGR